MNQHQTPNQDATDVRGLRAVFGMNRGSSQTQDFSKFHYDNAFHDPPPPTKPYPYRLPLEDVLGVDAVTAMQTSGQMVFHCVGDTGNSKYGAEAQDNIAAMMEAQVQATTGPDRPAFFYHLGDVVYFYGEKSNYESQFYDPYLHYPQPIFAIPGNHDGAIIPGGDPSLQGFVENFCSSQPTHIWMAGASNRTTMIQPNCYWTLMTPFATIIGLYSNVPGQLDHSAPTQQSWLTAELKAAKDRGDKCVIVTVHHPAYSLDDVHGGHSTIQNALDQAYKDSGRIPNLVLAGHVHNYQRFERTMGSTKIPYVVAGAGGYAGYSNLHQLKSNAQPPAGVQLITSNTQVPGFLRLTVTQTSLVGEYFLVPQKAAGAAGPSPAVSAAVQASARVAAKHVPAKNVPPKGGGKHPGHTGGGGHHHPPPTAPTATGGRPERI